MNLKTIPPADSSPHDNIMKHRSLVLVATFLAVALIQQASGETSLLQPKDRIVFIGDSITGQGANIPAGWAHQIEAALREVKPDANYTFVSLGGSGQTVGSWQNVEKKSRTESAILDVKTVDVKEALDQPAGVVICMLGMNDVLRPSLKDTPEDFEKWAASYRELIKAVRDRAHPRVFALATPTMCTEDPGSPKNQIMEKLIAKIGEIAKTENCVVLPTYETMREVLGEGRAYQPNFHVTGDSVHPGGAGHVAIAAGMLKGLGEVGAAAKIRGKLTSEIVQRAGLDALSYTVERLPSDLKSNKETFVIRYFAHPSQPGSSPKASLSLPDGWKEISSKTDAAGGEFKVEGIPDRLVNRLLLKVDSKQVEISLPAPWLIGVGNVGGSSWFQGRDFDPNKKISACDDSLRTGAGFGELAAIEPGHPLVWKRHIASVDFGGENTPGAIDMAAVTFYQNFDVAYAARWIYSEAERQLTIQIQPKGFGADSYMTLWWNGEKLFSDPIKTEKNRALPVTVRKGWNSLVFKSNHCQTQWQFLVDLAGENLDSLRVSASPPTQ